MTNTKKFVAAAALGAALALSAAGTATAQSRGVILDPPAGTTCINTGGAYAQGVVYGSPGVLSGNQIQIPIHMPINICGNSVSLIG